MESREKRKGGMVMRKTLIIAAAIVLGFFSHAFAADLGTARLTLIKGDVALYDEEAEGWTEAAINMPLIEGDRLLVQEGGRAEIHLRGRTYVRLDGGSSLDIVELGRKEARFFLASGKLYVSDGEYGIEDISVETPVTEVHSDDGSVLKVDVSAAGETEVSVLRGYVSAEDRRGWSRIREGQSLYIYEDRYAERRLLGDGDGWERWNRRRDRRLAEYADGGRHLPRELQEYAYDFDAHGRWVHVAAHGYVWTPTLSVGISWAPYRHGTWRLVRDNYVWVSYEPWGWVPYHFGRWVYVSRVGWCWVPPRHRQLVWAPGLVAWVTSSSHVAWVPLAPGEIYYGYGHYGPRSVNISINFRKTVVRPVYRNVHVHNSVTVIHRDTFLFGKRVALKRGSNPFLKAKPSYGPPGIKWKKAHKHRVVKKVKVYEKPGKHKRVIKTKRVHQGKDRRVVETVKKRGRPLSVNPKERLERRVPKSHETSERAPERVSKRLRGSERDKKEMQRARKPFRKVEAQKKEKVVKRVRKTGRPLSVDRKDGIERGVPKSHAKRGRTPERVTKRMRGTEREAKEVQRVRKPLRKVEGGMKQKVVKPKRTGGPQKERVVQKKLRHSRDVKTVKPGAGRIAPGKSGFRGHGNTAKRKGSLRAQR
jgi:hypothetical protein